MNREQFHERRHEPDDKTFGLSWVDLTNYVKLASTAELLSSSGSATSSSL